jgi:PmbA protein
MELADQAVKKALKMNATEAEAYVQKTRTVRVEFAEEIQDVKTVESVGFSLRVALGKKVAMHSTSLLDKKEVDEATAKVVKIAKVAPEDPDWKHLNSKFGKSLADGYYDSGLEDMAYEEIVEKLSSSVKSMKEYDKRVKPTRGILSISNSTVSIASSRAESLERKETNVEVWMRTKAEESGLESTGNEHQEARFWKEIRFEDLAVKAAERAVKFLKAKPIRSGKTSVIIRNQVFANILGVILGFPITADWVQKGRSPLSNKFGTQVASGNVTIVDDGLIHGGWKTKPFDDEGYPTQRTPVIEKGVLKNYLYDAYTALKANTKSTGNAQRQFYWLKPQPAANNLILKAGDADVEEIVRETKRGIYVEETIGEWLSNPVSGNLNATVTHGYRVENGELKAPVKGVVLSGDFYELLKRGIETVSNDSRNSAENCSPTIKLAQVTISGQ